MLIGSLSEDVHLQPVKKQSNLTLRLLSHPHFSSAVLAAVFMCVCILPAIFLEVKTICLILTALVVRGLKLDFTFKVGGSEMSVRCESLAGR